MGLDTLRYNLTKHMKRVMFTYENFKLLIHPDIDYDDVLERLNDDLDLMPEIQSTKDDIEIKFYRYDYKENIFSKSELLAFVFASINKDWDIIKGIDINTGKVHYFLKCDNRIFDPSLGVITVSELYSNRFITIKVI